MKLKENEWYICKHLRELVYLTEIDTLIVRLKYGESYTSCWRKLDVARKTLVPVNELNCELFL